MAEQEKHGPFVMPWQAGHREELFIIIITAIFTGIISSTIIANYRQAPATPSEPA